MKRASTAHLAPPVPGVTASGPSERATAPLNRGAAVPLPPLPAALLGATGSGPLRFPNDHPLNTWRSLNRVLEKLTEIEAWEYLEMEKNGPARVQLLLRLYGRANKLRAQRERRAVLGG
jgi:hypothetical protein